jgi:hypothetical protein
MNELLTLSLIPIILLVAPLILANFNFDTPTHAYAKTPYVFTNISGIYNIPNLGFQITLPEGWSGIGLKDFVMVSPMGINSQTAVPNPSNDIDKVIFVLSVVNQSDILKGSRDLNMSLYEQYVEKTAKSIGCKILSNKFVKVNGTTWEELHQVCGPQSEQEAKSFAISSGKSIVFVGIKGKSPAYEHNIKKFDESVSTIRMNNLTDIMGLVSSIS